MKFSRGLIYRFCGLAAVFTLGFGVRHLVVYGPISGHTKPLSEPIPAYTRALRPNYPFSIIAGGVYSAGELQYADREDAVVKAHYADFDIKNARMVQLTEDRYQYVSYRVKQKVYWTKKKLRIPKGEVLITDGGNWARARCGNRLSSLPHPEVSDQEPPLKALAAPPMKPGMPMELAEAPPVDPLSNIIADDIRKFPPVLPPANSAPPVELPPLAQVVPVMSQAPQIPAVFSPSTSSQLARDSTALSTPMPPILPPNGSPVTIVPEPRILYLFLVTFVVSLYGLTRLMADEDK
jgi:hypothetical protein